MKFGELTIDPKPIGSLAVKAIGIMLGGLFLYLGMGLGALAARSVDFLKPLGW